jgi:hypothetical protein
MATYNKFNAWADTMPEGANLATDQFTLALTNTLPVATNSVLADITQISYTNLSSRNFTTTSATQTGGTFTLVLNDLVLTASGAVATFRYAVLYDDTVAGDPLVGWWDYGSSITMANAETFTVDFTGAAITLS